MKAREATGVTAVHLIRVILTQAEIESVLALAAAAAHGTGDRTSAPLASFLAGVAASGTEHRTDMLDRIRQRTGAITGPQSGSAT
ncbi:MAG TPA: DUF6457 domain-containing protein [Solirubrobacteraceae bacterium]|nr:DUF6457 domain-containing protein [Solirubrobacteraceae bacterium]